MALGDLYATPVQLADRLGQALADVGDIHLLRVLNAASRAVETFTRRQFNRDDDVYATPRRFRALDCQRVAVDDFHTLEGLEVEVNGRLWDPAWIDPRPWDGIRHGQINWPYSDLFAVHRSFPWSRRVLVTVWAHWGWAEVPAGIVEATLDVAEMMSLAVTTGQSTKRSETIAGYSVSFAIPSMSASTDAVPSEFIKALPFQRKVFGVA
jgi:hypothetical protein